MLFFVAETALADGTGFFTSALFTGDLRGNFLALNARSGKELYRFNTGGPIAGGVVTYQQKGRQYVAVASGSSGGSIPLTGSATIIIFGQ